MTLQNQKMPDEKYKYFRTILIFKSNYNSQSISTCCDKSDGLSYGKLRAVSSAQITKQNLAQNIIRDTTDVEKKEID